MSVQENYKYIKSLIQKNIQLVVVSKKHPPEKIQEIYDLGHKVFGENKVQELTEKFQKLPKDIKWHLIGHLQTNKVKYVAEFVDMIQSVDSEKLLIEINRQAGKHNRKIKILLQIKIAEENSKTGLKYEDAIDLFKRYLDGNFRNVEISGVMGMATFTEDKSQIKKEFIFLRTVFNEFSKIKKMEILSMGMSDDFQTAIECGANSVRIGSAIFGDRNYNI